MKKIIFITTVTISILLNTLQAEETLDLKGTTIIGNRELPKVLYIMPWKSTNVGTRPARPEIEPPLAELDPLDITSFRRKVLIYSASHGNASD